MPLSGFLTANWLKSAAALQTYAYALQSRPVYLRDRKPYGTFVLAYREPRNETDWDAALMTFAADAAGLIIQSDLDGVTNIAE